MATLSREEAGGENILAFLDMIAVAEIGERSQVAAHDDGQTHLWPPST